MPGFLPPLIFRDGRPLPPLTPRGEQLPRPLPPLTPRGEQLPRSIPDLPPGSPRPRRGRDFDPPPIVPSPLPPGRRPIGRIGGVPIFDPFEPLPNAPPRLTLDDLREDVLPLILILVSRGRRLGSRGTPVPAPTPPPPPPFLPLPRPEILGPRLPQYTPRFRPEDFGPQLPRTDRIPPSELPKPIPPTDRIPIVPIKPPPPPLPPARPASLVVVPRAVFEDRDEADTFAAAGGSYGSPTNQPGGT